MDKIASAQICRSHSQSENQTAQNVTYYSTAPFPDAHLGPTATHPTGTR